MKRLIVLTEFKGAGKTTVGKIVTRKLGLPFFDTDRIVEKEEGMGVAEIFEKRGEQYFRKKEGRSFSSFSKARLQ